MSAGKKIQRSGVLPPDPVVEELEPRVLLSAGIEAALLGEAVAVDLALPELFQPAVASVAPSGQAGATSSASTRHELVFIDAATPDSDALIEQLLAASDGQRHLEVVLLDSRTDGVVQISQTLMARGDLDAVHIISHGSDGALRLGNTWFNTESLDTLAGLVSGWGDALSAEADLLLYGCDLASAAEGRSFIARLASLTGADVAASDDITGHASLGGDWNLEIASGRIETDIAVDEATQDAWRGALTTVTFREGDAGYLGTHDTELRSSASGNSFGAASTITIELNGGASGEQGLIRFDNIFGVGPGQIPPGATITSATLTFEATDNGSTISLHRMLQAWSESSTWDSMAGGIQLDNVEALAAADSTVLSPGTGSIQFAGLAATLQAWANGDPNHGWAIVNSSNDGVDVASSENGTLGFRPVLEVTYTAGSGSISGTIYEDLDGDANLGDAVGAAGVDVHLYLDDGDGVIDAGDTLLGTDTTDVNGDYTFAGLADATYWVVVDSTTIEADAGYNSGFDGSYVWAEQTWGSAGAVSFNGSYGYLGSAGALYGGMQAQVSDDASALVTAEHVTRVTLSGSPVLGVDSAFSFNVVTNTDDSNSGPGNRTEQGSLRQFIGNSNAISGTQSSLFRIGTTDTGYNGSGNGEYTISLTTGWDSYLTDTVILDATTQAGYGGSPIIELDVSGVGFATAGLTIRANDSTIRGFIVHGSPDEGIEIDGSTGFGDNNTIQNNWIGLDASGAVIGNAEYGLMVSVDVSGNQIGGTGPNEGNVIVGSGFAGIVVQTNADNNVFEGNYVGVGPDGVTPMGNNSHGIEVGATTTGNTIGGTAPGAGNLIANNNGAGVALLATAGTGNAIHGNIIFSNTGLGIDLGADGITPNVATGGPNDSQNFPVLTSASFTLPGNLTIDGTLDAAPGTTYRIEFFASSVGDGSGHGEAETYLGFALVTTDGTGHVAFSETLAVTVGIGDEITATATDPASNTSEFGANIVVIAGNQAPVLTPAAPSMPGINEDNTNNPGQQISVLLGGSVSDGDAGAVEGIAITGLVSGNGSWEYSLDGGASWIAVGAVSDSNALLLADTDWVRFVPDGANADAGSFTYRAWDRTYGTSGTKFDVTVNGGLAAFSTATDTASITVTAVNDAPVLAATLPTLPPITEDDFGNGGQQISTLLGAAVSDVDTGATEGIAITGLVSGNGTWEYSLDGGATWIAVGAVSNANALLLTNSDWIRFVPDSQNADAASFTFRAWDQTAGAAGSKVDVSTNGGIAAFSSATDTASITVTAINDAPLLTPAAPTLPTITEDDTGNGGQQIGSLLGGSVSDVDSGAIEGIAITGLVSGNGTWEYSLDGGATWIAVGAVSNANALLLTDADWVRFVPDGQNADAASFSFRAWDQTAGVIGTKVDVTANGGQTAFSTATDTASITVTAVNDAPLLTPAAPTLPTITEDDTGNPGQQVGILIGGSVSDVDAGAIEGIAITGLVSGNGTWEYSLDGGATWIAVGAVSNANALLLTDADWIRFVPDGANADSASFTFRAWDQAAGAAGSNVDVSTNGGTTAFSSASDTASITVTALNDAPVMAATSPTLAAITEDDTANGGQQIGILLGGSVSDVDSGAIEGIAITGLVSGNGTWEYSLDGGATWIAVGAVSNANALLLTDADWVRFVPDGQNADAASFSFRAWDQTAGVIGTKVDVTANGGQTAFSTATDTASITVTAVNDAPLLTPASPTLPTITEDDTGNPGQQVGILLGGSVSDVDSGAIEGIAITGLVSGNGTWEYSLDGGATWIAVGAVSEVNALLLTDADWMRFVPDGANADSASFMFRAWDQTAGVIGTKVDVTANGGQTAFSTATDTASITVTAVNDAPLLTPAAPTLPTITEDDTGNPGQQVGILIGGSVSDVDAGAIEGIAITGLVSGNGTWEYSLDGGATWIAVGAVSNANALLLTDADWIRFVPDGANADSASFTFRAWDQAAGAAGSNVDVSTNGGTTAFSSASDTASITVTALNDAPVMAATSPTLAAITEDDTANGGQQIGILLGGSVSDVDSGAIEGIAITGLVSGNGTWEYSLDGGATWIAVGAVSNANALLLTDADWVRFVPDGQNADAASFSFRAWDQTAGVIGTKVDVTANGGQTAFSTATDTASITVTAVNDAPLLTPASPTLPTITEDDTGNPGQQVGILLGGSVSDVDSGAIEGIAITGLVSGNGTWEYSLDSGATWIAVGAVSDANALLLTDTNRIRFVPDGQNADSASFSFRAWDQNAGVAGTKVDVTTNGGQTPYSTAADTASITVTAVNDAPVLDNSGTMTLSDVAEDETAPTGDTVAALLASAGGDRLTDPDTGALEGIAVVAADNTNGIWSYSIDGGTTWTDFASVSSTSAVLLASDALIRFVPAAGYSGAGGEIGFRGWDRSAGFNGQVGVDTNLNGASSAFSAAIASAGISVLPVNDAPSTSGIAAVIAEEDAAPTAIDLFAAFADLEDADNAMTYTVVANTNAALFDTVSIDGATGLLTLGYAANAHGTAALTIRATDTGGASVEANFTVTVEAVNDLPTTSGLPDLSGIEDSAPITVDLWTLFADIEDADADLSFFVTGNTDPGLITPTVDNPTGTAAFALTADAYGLSEITVRAVDSDGGFVETTFAIQVTAQNDAPVAAGFAPVAVAEDSPGFTLDLFGAFSDIDDPVMALTFTVVGMSGDPVVATDVDGMAGTLGLDFLPDQHGNTTVTVRATDTFGAYAEADVVIAVSAVDDPTEISVPAPQTVMDDSVVLFSSNFGSAIRIADADNDNITVTLSVTGGTLSLADAAGITFIDGDGQTDTRLSFSGSLASVNAALEGLSFRPNSGFDGYAALEISSHSTGGLDQPADGDTARLGILVLNADNVAPPLSVEAEDRPTPELHPKVMAVKSGVDRQRPNDPPIVLPVPVIPATTLLAGPPSPKGPPASPPQEPPDRSRSGGNSTPDDYLSSITQRLLALRSASEPMALVVAEVVFDALDALKMRLDASGEDYLAENELVVSVASGVTLTLSAGFVTWLMRAGTLVTSLLSTSPVWRSFDPLPVLGSTRHDEEDEFHLHPPARDDRAEALFDRNDGEQV